MANHPSALGRMDEVGVPVQGAVGVGPFAGEDRDGKPCLYAVMGQEAGDEGGLFVLQIDPASGACRRYDAPVPAAGGRPAYWSRRWRCLFIGASGREHHPTHESGWLLRFDPRRDAMESLGVLVPGQNRFPAGIAEAADGSVYLGDAPHCSLFRWDPASGRIENCGRADPDDQYAYPVCSADGTVAVLVRMARPHVVVYDRAAGAMVPVGPVADKERPADRVDVFTLDGHLHIDSHKGRFRIQGTKAEPTEATPPAPAPSTLPDGSTFRFFGPQPPRLLEIRRPDGTQVVHHLDYTAAGVEIYLVRPGPNGRIYGSSVLPLHFFDHDPATGRLTDHGYCCTSSGETYSMDWMDGKLYLCSYTHAVLCEYDPQQPYNFSFVRQVDGEWVEVKGTYDPAWPCRFQFGPDDNPRQLGRMDTVAFRPRDMVAGPAGKVWVTSMPDYGMWNGTLSWYDPKTGQFGGAHRNIVPHCSPQAITWIHDRNLLALGFSIYGGSGTTPRTTRAGLALWDPETDREIWHGDLGLELVGVMDLEYSGNGLVYAIVHPQPENVLHADLLLVDLPNQRIVARTVLSGAAGWPLEVTFQRDARYLYGATRESVYRVPLGTTDVEVLWRQPGNGPTAGGALLSNDYYFGSGARLRRVRVG